MGQKPLTVDPLSLALASTLRNRQKALGISDYTLSERSGISRPRLRRCLVGERPFLVGDFHAAALALGLVPWQVVRDAETSLETSL